MNYTDPARFDRAIAAGGSVFVQFSADWCAPCEAISPVFSAAAAAYRGPVRFMKLDAGACCDIAATCGVRGIPALLLIAPGVVARGFEGAPTVAGIHAFLDAETGRPPGECPV